MGALLFFCVCINIFFPSVKFSFVVASAYLLLFSAFVSFLQIQRNSWVWLDEIQQTWENLARPCIHCQKCPAGYLPPPPPPQLCNILLSLTTVLHKNTQTLTWFLSIVSAKAYNQKDNQHFQTLDRLLDLEIVLTLKCRIKNVLCCSQRFQPSKNYRSRFN